MIAFIINGILWRVRIVPPTFPLLLNYDGKFTLGCCDNNTQTIYIADGLSERKFMRVLGHEITHAAMYSYDVSLTYDQEELIADIVATYGNEIVAVTNRVFNKIKNREKLVG
jgi:hypothetical protein